MDRGPGPPQTSPFLPVRSAFSLRPDSWIWKNVCPSRLLKVFIWLRSPVGFGGGTIPYHHHPVRAQNITCSIGRRLGHTEFYFKWRADFAVKSLKHWWPFATKSSHLSGVLRADSILWWRLRYEGKEGVAAELQVSIALYFTKQPPPIAPLAPLLCW